MKCKICSCTYLHNHFEEWKEVRLTKEQRERLHDGYLKFLDALYYDEEERRKNKKLIPHCLIDS